MSSGRDELQRRAVIRCRRGRDLKNRKEPSDGGPSSFLAVNYSYSRRTSVRRMLIALWVVLVPMCLAEVATSEPLLAGKTQLNNFDCSKCMPRTGKEPFITSLCQVCNSVQCDLITYPKPLTVFVATRPQFEQYSVDTCLDLNMDCKTKYYEALYSFSEVKFVRNDLDLPKNLKISARSIEEVGRPDRWYGSRMDENRQYLVVTNGRKALFSKEVSVSMICEIPH